MMSKQRPAMPLTKRQLLQAAAQLEQEIVERTEQGHAGSYEDFLHHQVQHLRMLAVTALEQ
jgi:hypothetical protein